MGRSSEVRSLAANRSDERVPLLGLIRLLKNIEKISSIDVIKKKKKKKVDRYIYSYQ